MSINEKGDVIGISFIMVEIPMCSCCVMWSMRCV